METNRMLYGVMRWIHRTGPLLFSLAVGMLLFGAGARGQEGYQKPPKAVLDVLNAPVTPRASVGQARDIVLLYSPEPYPPITDVARPFARLAGLRIDAATNGPHNGPRFDKFVLKKVADGNEIKVATPAGMIVSQPFWAPGGRKIAFTHAMDSGIELWVADARTGEARAIAGMKLNAALSTPGARDENPPCHWLPGSKALLCQTIPGRKRATA